MSLRCFQAGVPEDKTQNQPLRLANKAIHQATQQAFAELQGLKPA